MKAFRSMFATLALGMCLLCEAASASTATSSPPPVPENGAYLGAWVYYDHNASKQGQVGPAAQLDVLEQDLGRRFDIGHAYYCFDGTNGCNGQLTGNAATNSDQQYGRMPLDSWSCSTTSGYTLGDIISGYQAWKLNPATPSPVIAYIIGQAKSVAAYGTTTYIRWAWEMLNHGANGDCVSSDGGAANYVAAWQAIYNLFHYYQANNAVFVWCPSAGNFNSSDGNPLNSPAAEYYPGNGYVDYVCADGYNDSGQTSTFATKFDNAYKFAMIVNSAGPMPFMVGETGDEAADPNQATWTSSFYADIKAGYPYVKAIVYFDSYNCKTQNDFTLGWPAGQVTVPPSLDAMRTIMKEGYFNPRGLSLFAPASQTMLDTFKPGCSG